MLWISQNELVGYETAVSEMEHRVAGIHAGTDEEAVWLVEHPPLYTAGSSANPKDLLNPRFPVFETGRGGQYTYHGPGQLVGYPILTLADHAAGEMPSTRAHVLNIEHLVIEALADLGLAGASVIEGSPGVWLDADGVLVMSHPTDDRSGPIAAPLDGEYHAGD